MAAEPNQTVSGLRRRAVVEDEITPTTDAYLADPKIDPFWFGSGHKLDAAAAVETQRLAKATVAEKGLK